MTSYKPSTLEKLADLLNLTAEVERKVEITRQVLVENRDFDAVEVFKHLDLKNRCKISKRDLLEFLENNEIKILSKEVNMLFEHLDRDSDGYIDWEEFIKTVISKDCSFYEETQFNPNLQAGDLSLELRHSLVRVFEEELKGLKILDQNKFELFNDKNFDLALSFKKLDIGKKDYLDIRDIYDFISFHVGQITYNRAERVLRRIDLDLDGKVIFGEWQIALRPRCLGKRDYYDRIISDDVWVLDQKIKEEQDKTAKRVIARYRGRSRDNSLHDSKIQITPTKLYRRSPKRSRSKERSGSHRRNRSKERDSYIQRKRDNSFSKSIPKNRDSWNLSRDIFEDETKDGNSPSFILLNNHIVTRTDPVKSSRESESPQKYADSGFLSPHKQTIMVSSEFLDESKGTESLIRSQLEVSTPEVMLNSPQNHIEINVFQSPATKPEKAAKRPCDPVRNLRRNRSPERTQAFQVNLFPKRNRKSELEALSPEKVRDHRSGDSKIRNSTSKYSRSRKREIEEIYNYKTPPRSRSHSKSKKYGGVIDRSTTAGKPRRRSRSKEYAKIPNPQYQNQIFPPRLPESSKLQNLPENRRSNSPTIYDSKFEREKGYTNSPYKNLDYERLVRRQGKAHTHKLHLEGFFNDLDNGDRTELINALEELLNDNRELEETRIQLSLRFDFNLLDMFNLVAGSREMDFINSKDLFKFMKDLNVMMISMRDAELLLERYDKNKDGFLDFNEFKEIFAPFDYEYRTPLMERAVQGICSLREYTNTTEGQMRDLIQKILIAEKNLDFSRALIYSRLFTLFGMIDVRYQGNISIQDLSEALEKYGLETSRKELCALIDKFDYDFDGMINFEEFIEFFTPKKVSSPMKRPGRMY